MVTLSSRPHNPCYPAIMVRSPQRPEPRARITALACLGVCTIACGCADMPGAPPAPRPTPPPAFLAPRAGSPAIAIGVLVAGWHSGIVLPAAELGPLRSLLTSDPAAQYLSFGWGNRRFYMAAHPRSGDALAALFRSPSVLFVQGVSAPADLLVTDVGIHWVCADRAEVWRAASYIDRALARSDGKPIGLGRGPLPGSRFYASSGHYSAVHTCNTWTVAALQYAGLPVRAGGVIFAGQVPARIAALRACPAP